MFRVPLALRDLPHRLGTVCAVTLTVSPAKHLLDLGAGLHHGKVRSAERFLDAVQLALGSGCGCFGCLPALPFLDDFGLHCPDIVLRVPLDPRQQCKRDSAQ
jgi:hypothetical protein